MPVHNGAAFLKSSVGSIQAQTVKDFILIAVDDNSSILAATDQRIVVLRTEGVGASEARNLGVSAADTEFVCVLDQDDLCKENRLEVSLKAIRSGGFDVLSSSVLSIDADGTALETLNYPTSHEEISDNLNRWCCICHSSVIYRREAIEAMGGYRPMFLTANDYDLWLRLEEQGHTFGGVRETLVQYRLHDRSLGARSGRRSLWEKTNVLVARWWRYEFGVDPFDNGLASPGLIAWELLEILLDKDEMRKYVVLKQEDSDEREYKALLQALNRAVSAGLSLAGDSR